MKELNLLEKNVLDLFNKLNSGDTCVSIAKKSTNCNCSFADNDGKCMLTKIENNLKKDGYIK